MTLDLRDAGIASPFPDPTTGVTTVTLHGGVPPARCFVTTELDPAGWRAIGSNGVQRGYRWRQPAPGTSGIRRVLLKPGRVLVKAKGSGWPCALSGAQRLPVTAVLAVNGTRYCGAFGGSVESNGAGLFLAEGAAPPAACPKTDVTVANLNILHGLFCPGGSSACRYPERIALLQQWLQASGCPDLVTLQEIVSLQVPVIQATLPGACNYQMTYQVENSADDQMVLSRYPVPTFVNTDLYKGFRNVTWARVDHPMGAIDLFSTHLSSSSDGAGNPCVGDCPADCVAAGAATVRQCQAVQVAKTVEARHDLATPAILTGDFNDQPGSFVHQQFTSRGWADSHLVAGNPECDGGATGVGCTSGRNDAALTDLESPASNETVRIDYTFVVPSTVPSCTIEPAGDPDGDAAATRIFADLPNPFAGTCGPAPDPICWPSDHEGSELDLNCG